MKNFFAFTIAVLIVAISANYFFEGYKERLLYDDTMSSHPDQAYSRMIKTGILRCGYILSEPALMRDEQTGQLSGIFYDYVEAVGEALSVDISWSVELHSGDNQDVFGHDLYDIECSGAYSLAGRLYDVSYITPFYLQENEESYVHKVAIALPPYEIRLHEMINNITQDLINNGQAAKIISDYSGNNYKIKTP